MRSRLFILVAVLVSLLAGMPAQAHGRHRHHAHHVHQRHRIRHRTKLQHLKIIGGTAKTGASIGGLVGGPAGMAIGAGAGAAAGSAYDLKTRKMKVNRRKK